ncbi:MAG: hypothetical protein LBB43_04115 [Spirochaetaceae bacterium]|nr:hypothetical protein [Spirochaetaceae bacterium]
MSTLPMAVSSPAITLMSPSVPAMRTTVAALAVMLEASVLVAARWLPD